MKFKYLLIIFSILLVVTLVSSLDEEAVVSCGGDGELIIGCLGDEEMSFVSSYITPSTTSVDEVSSPSGGSPSFYPTQSNLEEGYSKSMGRNWKLKFDVDNESHELKLDKIDKVNKTATVSVSSELQTRVLSVGEGWKVNLDSDEDYDLLIRLENVTLFRADIFVMEINEEIFVDVISGNVVEGNESSSKEEERNNYWLWIVVLVLIVLGILVWKKCYKKIRNKILYR